MFLFFIGREHAYLNHAFEENKRPAALIFCDMRDFKEPFILSRGWEIDQRKVFALWYIGRRCNLCLQGMWSEVCSGNNVLDFQPEGRGFKNRSAQSELMN